MNIIFLIAWVSLFASLFILAGLTHRNPPKQDTSEVDALKQRVTTLERLLTDPDRGLRRDFDGLN